MILYHFTPLQTLSGGKPLVAGDLEVAIDGLKPFNNDHPEMPPVVWLTDDYDPGGPTEKCCFARIKLIIPPSDPRLCSQKDFLRRWVRKREPSITSRHISDCFDEMRRKTDPDARFAYALRHWWAYEGAIPLGRWAGIEIVENQQVWWGALGGYRIGRGPAHADAAVIKSPGG